MGSVTGPGTVSAPASLVRYNDDIYSTGATNIQQIIDSIIGLYSDLQTTGMPNLIAGVRDLFAHAPFEGGAGYRPHNMEQWWNKLNNADLTPTDIVVIGNSIEVQVSSGYPAKPWPWQMRDRLNKRACRSDAAGVDGVFADASQSAALYSVTSSQGTPSTTGMGGYATALSNGQKVTHTCTCDGFSIVYGKGSGTRSLIVRDGVGGTVLDTINTSGSGSSWIWTSGALSSTSRTIEIEAVGSGNIVEFVQPYLGDRTRGVRMWPCAHSGYQTSDYSGSNALALDLISQLSSAGTLGLIIIATGTNDNPVTTSEWDTLLASIRNLTSCDILLYVPYESTAMTRAEADDLRTWAENNMIPTVDPTAIIGEIVTADGVHPTDNTKTLLADVVTYAAGGDPIGYPNLVWRKLFQTMANVQAWASANNRAKVEEWAGLGRLTFSIYDTLTDSQPSVVSMPGYLSNLLGMPATGSIALGPGGSTTPDTYIGRAAAGTVQIGASGAGVVYAGRRQAINAQTGTSYSVVLADQAKIITRSNGSSSTQVWPKDATQAIPVGTIIETVNLGAGSITHSAESGASLVTGSATTQAQGKRVMAIKTAANTWSLTTSA